jgi:hypothetical protein
MYPPYTGVATRSKFELVLSTSDAEGTMMTHERHYQYTSEKPFPTRNSTAIGLLLVCEIRFDFTVLMAVVSWPI